MITTNFKEKLSSLGKSVLDIARETGVNRNTITALMKNDVTGIKFDTLFKLCSTYGWQVEDLVSFSQQSGWDFEHVYRQDAQGVPLMMDSPAHACGVFDFAVGNNKRMGYNSIYVHCEDGHSYWYFDKPKMNELAQGFYDHHVKDMRIHSVLTKFEAAAKKLEGLYLNTKQTDCELIQNRNDILQMFKTVWDHSQECWRHSVFVDSFDAGVDREIIERVKKQHSLSAEEVSILTTPPELPYSYEMEFEALCILRDVFRNETMDKSHLEKALQDHSYMEHLLHKYAYVHSNYAAVKSLTVEDLLEIAQKNSFNKSAILEKINEYESFAQTKQRLIKEVLNSRGLQENPLAFFERLTYLRERRKQINLMSIHLKDFCLRSIEAAIGVRKELLTYLTYAELESALYGIIKSEHLEDRKNDAFMVCIQGRGRNILAGQEARSLRDQLEESMKSVGENKKILSGSVASQGYAKGVARVVMSEDQFDDFKEGEILVTGMTRPEFVPLMKRAAAIVTNEGGITCHAAIVSRELGKPCIIGTQRATELIKDGDLVEVRAHHGTVRILS